ncbi:hypothetical protein MMC30_008329 [Trapelia coarctata]|nr:hypothetical protein [Trapelia coarctata]
MAHNIPPADLDPRNLLPPLLACLLTAFVSPRPPPALLPLLSPILRQRVQLLSATAASPSESWLPLLCWESAQASKLAGIVESSAFEPHPVSGEIEYGDLGDLNYRRLDEETLQSRVILHELRIIIIYLWCEGDQEGGGSGWRVSELSPAEGISTAEAQEWCNTISEANERARRTSATNGEEHGRSSLTNGVNTHQDEEDDDDYWAQYDTTPGRTPAIKRSPAPSDNSNAVDHHRTTSDTDYYAQYAQVQPAMDNHDPSEELGNLGPSSLNGDTMIAVASRLGAEASNGVTAPPTLGGTDNAVGIVHTRPSSSSSASDTVARLEDSAASQSHAEIAIQQHISSSLKSLYRLARATGIEREEFDRLVKTELDTLGLMTEDG